MNRSTIRARRWTAFASTIAAGLVVATTASTATANAPTRIDVEYWGVDCIVPVGVGSTLFLYGSGSTDTADGGFGAFVEDAEGMVIAESVPGERVSYGDSLDVDLTLVGDAGTQILDLRAGLDAGEPVVEEIRERSGNSWTRGTTSEAPLTVTTTLLTLDGVALDPAAGWCAGTLNAFDVVTTEPSRTVYHDTGFDSAVCDVAGMPETQVRVSGPWPEVVVEIVIDHGEAGADKATGIVNLRSGKARLYTELLDYWTGEKVTDLAVTLSGTRGPGGPEHETASGDGITERTRITPYDLTIDIADADGRRGTVTCDGWLVSSTVKMSGAAG